MGERRGFFPFTLIGQVRAFAALPDRQAQLRVPCSLMSLGVGGGERAMGVALAPLHTRRRKEEGGGGGEAALSVAGHSPTTDRQTPPTQSLPFSSTHPQPQGIYPQVRVVVTATGGQSEGVRRGRASLATFSSCGWRCTPGFPHRDCARAARHVKPKPPSISLSFFLQGPGGTLTTPHMPLFPLPITAGQGQQTPLPDPGLAFPHPPTPFPSFP